MKFTEPVLDNLINLISRLPGLGPKSARRIALHLLKNKENLIKPLADTLNSAHEKILRCKICGAIKSKDANCSISKCQYINHSYDQLCIVENIAESVNVVAEPKNAAVVKSLSWMLHAGWRNQDI